MKRKGIGSIASSLVGLAATAALLVPAVLVIEGLKLLSEDTGDNTKEEKGNKED